MTLIGLLNQFTFDDIKEQFLDLYPEENDFIKEYEVAYAFLRDTRYQSLSTLPNLELSFVRNDKMIPTLIATLANDMDLPLNSFEWSLAKSTTITDEMFIECSPERIAAITLYDFGSILIYTYAYPDTFVFHKE